MTDTKINADITIGTRGPARVLRIDDMVVGTFWSDIIHDVIVAGAAATGKTVYDIDAGQWLVGDVGQLDIA